MAAPSTKSSVDPWAVQQPTRRDRWRVPLAVLLGVGGSALVLARDHGPVAAGAVVVLGVAAGCAPVARRPWPALAAMAIAATIALLAAGALPTALAALGAIVAGLAVWPTEGTHSPRASLGLAPVVLGQVLWLRGAEPPTVAVLMVAGLGLTLLERAGQPQVVRLGAVLQRAVVGVAEVLGTICFLLVALPTVYLPGAAVRVAQAVRRSRGTAAPRGWVPHVERPVSAARRPYAATSVEVARSRNRLGLACVVLVGAGLVAATVVVRPDPPGAARSADTASTAGVAPSRERTIELLGQIEAVPWSQRAAFAAVPDADELQADFGTVRLLQGGPLGYRLGDSRSDRVNVVDGVRVTSASTCDCPRVRLWLMGGSAAFGLGQRDDRTIASELVRLAAADGIALEVTNLGVPGWTFDQEQRAVRERLASGAPVDVVVGYDGYNDVVGTVVTAGGGDVLGPVRLDPDAVGDFLAAASVRGRSVDGAELGRVAADQYRRQATPFAEDLHADGIDVELFFQADALGDPLQRDTADELYDGRFERPLHDIAGLDAALGSASRELTPQVRSLRDLFVGHPEPVFADTVHTNEEGAALVAAAIYEQLAPQLAGRAR